MRLLETPDLAKYAVALILVFTANAVVSGDYVVWGTGNDSCATFVQERARSSLRFTAEMNWIAGSTTQANAEWSFNLATKGIKSDLFKDLDNLALEAWLADYCKEHPLNNLNSAALALQKHLFERASDPLNR